MSEHIPEYIGSKLGAFHDEDVVLETTSEHPTESVDQFDHTETQVSPPPKEKKTMVNKRKKSPTGKVKRARKKTGEGSGKSLPVNPGAMKAVESDIPPVPVAELPDLESFSAVSLSPEAENKETNLAESLKGLSGKKKSPRAKKAVKRPSRNTKTTQPDAEVVTTSKLDQLVAEPEVETVDVPEPLVPKVQEVEKAVSKKKPARKKEAVKTKETKDYLLESPAKPLDAPSSSRDEIEQRRAYVKQLKDETHSFLKQLAIEREERVKSLERLRKEIRAQLDQK